MRRFRFRLQRVLELRQAQLRAREQEVALANRRLAEADQVVATRLVQQTAAFERIQWALCESAVSDLGWLDRSTAEWERSVADARADVEVARVERDRQVAQLLEIRSAVEALERLRDQQERQHRRDRRRREEKAMDERHLWSMVDEQAGGDRADDTGKD